MFIFIRFDEDYPDIRLKCKLEEQSLGRTVFHAGHRSNRYRAYQGHLLKEYYPPLEFISFRMSQRPPLPMWAEKALFDAMDKARSVKVWFKAKRGRPRKRKIANISVVRVNGIPDRLEMHLEGLWLCGS